MIATIEAGRRPRAFWLGALAMCDEHLGFYARENAFRANLLMMQSWVDAHNAGMGQALHYGQKAAFGGLSANIVKILAEELGDVVKPHYKWGDIDPIHTDGDDGFTFWVDPDADGSLYATWKTSGGNVLQLRLQGEWLTMTARGRRHGIPWRFLNSTGLTTDDLLVVAQDSESSAKPWCSGKGKPLWEPNGGAEWVWDHKYPTELAQPLEPYPDWADHSQQARMAADRMHEFSKLGGLIRACASVGADSSAIQWVEGTCWPYRSRPQMNWGTIARYFKIPG